MHLQVCMCAHNQAHGYTNTMTVISQPQWRVATETWAVRSCLPQQLGDMTNGAPESSMQQHGPKVYAVVQRTGSDRQQEVMAREWTVNHLQDEMRYIKEVSGNWHKQPGLQVDTPLFSNHQLGAVPGCVWITSVHSVFTGERFAGKGERADVRAVRRNAAINAEAFTGNQGNDFCNTMWPLIKLHPVKLWIKSNNSAYHLRLQTANSQRRSLESEVRVRTEAMESFDQMNSSLISANLGLQVTKSMSLSLWGPSPQQQHVVTLKAGLISKISCLCRNPFWKTVRAEWTGGTRWRVCGAPVRRHKRNSERRRRSWPPRTLRTRLWDYR